MKIITLTLSPAIDIEYMIKGNLNKEHVNRVSSQSIFAGGKGINVSRAIKNVAIENGDNPDDFLLTVAPVGGYSGQMLSSVLKDEGLDLKGIEISSNTRINVSLISENEDSTEINAPGTPVGEKRKDIENSFLDMIDNGDVAVVAGSTPSDTEKAYYSYLVSEIKKRGGIAVLDCDGEAMKIAVSESKDNRPDLIKPNTDELSELSGMKTDTLDEIYSAVEKLGIDNIITTMAGDGAVFTQNGDSNFYPTEKVKAIRQKGAGDTFLGNFIYWYYYKKECGDVAMKKAMLAAKKYVSSI